jgi:hypothetical protein
MKSQMSSPIRIHYRRKTFVLLQRVNLKKIRTIFNFVFYIMQKFQENFFQMCLGFPAKLVSFRISRNTK